MLRRTGPGTQSTFRSRTCRSSFLCCAPIYVVSRFRRQQRVPGLTEERRVSAHGGRQIDTRVDRRCGKAERQRYTIGRRGDPYVAAPVSGRNRTYRDPQLVARVCKVLGHLLDVIGPVRESRRAGRQQAAGSGHPVRHRAAPRLGGVSGAGADRVHGDRPPQRDADQRSEPPDGTAVAAFPSRSSRSRFSGSSRRSSAFAPPRPRCAAASASTTSRRCSGFQDGRGDQGKGETYEKVIDPATTLIIGTDSELLRSRAAR